jgi:hypothetical protein
MVANMKIKKRLLLVCAKILFLGMSIGASSQILAQETEEQEEVSKPEQDTISTTTSNQQQPILRLEDTIRGNKEQPQVLTIVPWQLPVHQRINENEEWQLQVNKLPSIERNAFLRRLAVVNEMKGVQKAQIASNAQLESPE